ncbi:U3-containing 90S pre-ribosomal complex subunit-domain containing protein [Sphaerosporella brunnea]|uniref:U3-containing 90S pre-ribosomal complex subunit-domain containing protein n=1 Tax=Sphaerosporella brunnea TaxID=1250544 RepID=A0A5J5EQT3_9PEZI|nr:U3-containing 90S pre-ribosomal complex subunit-domain containing protein [Sphaerosporella brunnea]
MSDTNEGKLLQTMDGETRAKSPLNKRKRKREKEKANRQLSEKKAKPVKLDRRTSSPPQLKRPTKPEQLDESIAQMDPSLTADYISQRIKKFEKDLSAVELEDRFIPASAFLDTTSYNNSRTLANLSEYLEQFSPSLARNKETNEALNTTGAPHTIIVTAAALRATDLARAVKRFQTKDSMVAKFFSKHIKLSEAIGLCNNIKIGVGVGTPARILALIREGALKLERLDAIVLDMSGLNKKRQGIFDIRETHKDILDLLNEPVIKSSLGDKIRLLVY